MNSDCAVLLRDGFRSGRVRLLVNEYDADELLSEIGGYNKLNPPEKTTLQMPYVDTTLLINELVRLQHDETNGKVRVYEKAGMRKDRYSSLAYNYYVAIQLENKLTKRHSSSYGSKDLFVIKPPSYTGKAVKNRYARTGKTSWR